ncbi:MAG: hypothetical protein V8R46_00915 [Eubacterium ramulus]
MTGQYRHMEDGIVMGATENDPLAELYWKTGIDAQPPLDKFETPEVTKFINVVDIRGAGLQRRSFKTGC